MVLMTCFFFMDGWFLDGPRKLPIRDIFLPEIQKLGLDLLESCTVQSPIQEIPKCSYKGILLEMDGLSVWFYIFPNSVDSLHIMIYVKRKEGSFLYGKYDSYALAMISIVEALSKN